MYKNCKICGKDFWQYKTVDICPCRRKPIGKNIAVKKINKPIKKVSDKRKVKDLQYYALRKVFMEKPENQVCPITGQKTVEVHHLWSGKNRDKHYLDTTTWLAVSREAHNYIHANPEEAREKGYLY